MHRQGHGVELPNPIGARFGQAVEPFGLIRGGRGGLEEDPRGAPIVGGVVVGPVREILDLDPSSILREQVEGETSTGVIVRQPLDLARREGQILDRAGEQIEEFFLVSTLDLIRGLSGEEHIVGRPQVALHQRPCERGTTRPVTKCVGQRSLEPRERRLEEHALAGAARANVDPERIERLDGAVAAFDALEGARAYGEGLGIP